MKRAPEKERHNLRLKQKVDLHLIRTLMTFQLNKLAIIIKKKFNLSQTSLLEVIISAGLILLVPAYLIEMYLGFKLNLNLPFVLTLSYVVLFPGLASFICWIKGISIIGSNRSGIFLHLMPIFSTVLAILIFKEKFMNFHLFGAIFIIGGIFLSSKKVKNV